MTFLSHRKLENFKISAVIETVLKIAEIGKLQKTGKQPKDNGKWRRWRGMERLESAGIASTSLATNTNAPRICCKYNRVR